MWIDGGIATNGPIGGEHSNGEKDVGVNCGGGGDSAGGWGSWRGGASLSVYW
jgi:hypothetical protein